MSTESIERYRALLPIPKHQLDEALEIQATVYDDLQRITARRNTEVQRAKDDLARVEGRLAEDFRADEVKMSVAAIDAKVRRHRDRIKAFDAYQEAREEHEEWLGLVDAWRQRGYAIKTLAELFVANYFSTTGTSVGADRREARDKMRTAYQQAARGEPERGGTRRRSLS